MRNKREKEQNPQTDEATCKISLVKCMVFRLWGIMMLLVILATVFVWIAQVYLFDKSYIANSVTQITEKVNLEREKLGDADLAENSTFLANLSRDVSGKLLVINDENKMIEAYSMGYPIAFASDCTFHAMWSSLQQSEYFKHIVRREYFQDVQSLSAGNSWLYIGIPVQYYGIDSYVVLVHSFADIYSMLAVNRKQLAVFCILLTIAASVIAAILSRRFTKPILEIKSAVDALAAGDLDAVPQVKRSDELGQLSISVKRLGVALKRVDRLRKEVIANVSHELRTPLAHIGGYAEMARDVHAGEPAKYTEDLDFIIAETSRMTEMVNDIMDYSQLQSGCIPLKKDRYNLYEIIDTEVFNCEKAARENHLSLVYKHDQEDYPMCLDALKMTQVIRNLIYNAINHTADGETIVVQSEAKTHSCGKTSVRVSVINPGDPIPEEERCIIWERYQRAQHQGGRKQGTGIGLSIVSSILNAHGMTYGVDCQDGLTIFWFEN